MFEPRIASLFPELGPVVWAVADSDLVNDLLLRDCPRVTFCAVPTTTQADRERFNVTVGRRVIVIESAWLERVPDAVPHLYEFPSDSFTLHDESAGYWLSRQVVAPVRVTATGDRPAAIAQRGGDLLATDRLWPLQGEVIASTLDYSIIRMRHAARARHLPL